MTIARMCFWGVMVLWGVVEVRGGLRLSIADRGQDRQTFAWSLGATLIGLAAALALDAVIPGVVPEDSQSPFLITGALIVALGIVLRQWSITTLGQWFTYQVRATADQPVLDSGPYRWVRHPSYTGLLVSCLGAGVASANVASLAVVIAVPLYGLTRRIRVEEAELVKAIGERYITFSRHRKRLIPGVW